MNNLDAIISKIEDFAPLSLVEDWDNSGWQVYLANKNINKVMLALSPTVDVVEKAAGEGCELLITHHPLVFEKINAFSAEDHAGLALIKAVQNNLQVYCAHTNLDKTKGGIAEVLAKKLGLNSLFSLDTGEETGLGRKGELLQEEPLTGIIDKVKQTLNSDKIKLVNPANIQKVRKIAILPGSGGGLISSLSGVDLYVTADVKYHDALSVKGFAVIDAGHFETERIILPVLKELLEGFKLKVYIAEEQLPWEYI